MFGTSKYTPLTTPSRHKVPFHIHENEYSYRFNGMEKTDEVYGPSNEYTTMFRQYDPRLGRWMTEDPKIHAWESPYVSMGNNPVAYNDIFGDEIINGYEKKLYSQKEKVKGLKDELSKLGDDEKGSRQYRKLDRKLQKEEKILAGIQDQYNDIKTAITDLEKYNNEEFKKLNSLTDARGTIINVYVIEESLLKSNFFTEGVNAYTSNPILIDGLTEIVPVEGKQYYFDDKGVMIEYKQVGSSNGPNTITIVINAQYADKGAVLAHEGGHALNDVPKMLELLEWYITHPGVSVGGHGGGNPSGNEAQKQEDIYKINKYGRK
jgi:RHS repeat-associated protein